MYIRNRFSWAQMAKYHIFWKFLTKKHCFRNKWQSTTFSRTRVSKTRIPHQFCHPGTVELEFVRLKEIMWYSSLANPSTMQHSTQIPFIKNKKIKKFYTVLKFGKLNYCVNFFFLVLFCFVIFFFFGIINK